MLYCENIPKGRISKTQDTCIDTRPDSVISMAGARSEYPSTLHTTHMHGTVAETALFNTSSINPKLKNGCQPCKPRFKIPCS